MTNEARAAQAAAGFPKKIPATISTPLCTVPGEGQEPARIYFGAAHDLYCLTAAGKSCDGFPVPLGEKATVVGAPAAGDLDADERSELAVALSDGRLLVVRDDASIADFSFRAPDFEAGPSFADLDGDGKAELLVGTKDGKLFALRAGAQPVRGFPISAGSSVTSSVSAGLLETRGKLALSAGAENGKVQAWDVGGALLPGLVPVATGYIVSGQPALGDLDGDGWGEVAVASQDFKVYAFDRRGRLLEGYPVHTGARMLAGPALGELGERGKLAVVVGGNDGKLHVLDERGRPLKGFPVKLGDKVVGSAAIADLDRDGEDEILAATGDGQLHALRANGKPFSGFPARLAGEPVAGPAVVDGGDGALLVVVGGGEKVFGFKVKRAGKSEAPLAWPQQGHDASRTGRVHPNPPDYAELAVQPAAPATNDALGPTYRFVDLDGDAEPSLDIRWLRDGKEVAELAGKREVPAALTRKGERWRFRLGGQGPARTSPEVKIGNSLPGRPGLAFEPPVARRAEALEVKVVQPSPDADGDAIKYRTQWLRNGIPQKGMTEPKLPAGTLTKGERWLAVVTPYDGEAEGPPATQQAIVEDSAPTAPEIALQPTAPKVGDAVKAIVKRESKDVDGDAIRYRYRFYVDGVAQPLASTVDALPAMTARKKQTIKVEVWAHDGQLDGPAATAQVVVANTPPTAPSAGFDPAAPRTGNVLVAGVAATSFDDDGDRLTYRFALSKGGKRLAEARELNGLKKGEKYELEIVANDGEADSPIARASATVQNTPPAAPAISFEGLPLKRGGALKVRVDKAAADPDGDSVSYRYLWSRNGEPQSSLTAAELPANTARKGERWSVTVTPGDGQADGTPARLETVAVDSAPSAPEIALSPLEARTTDEIRATIKKQAADIDGDRLTYRYRFFVDGTAQPLEPQVSALPAMTARKKQVVSVEVRADDGEQLSPPATASLTVLNTPPTAPRALLLPEKPLQQDELQAALAAPSSDVDGDRIAYRFAISKGGAKVAALADGRLVTKLKKGEKYELEIVASDGEAESPAARATATVQNSPPTQPAISFANSAPPSGEPVEVRFDRASKDADDDAVSYDLRFFVGGKPAGLASGAKAIPAGRIKKHEVWTVEVVPSDGAAAGPSARARLEAVNTAPTAPKVVIEPAEPTASSGATAKLVEPATDRDGDGLKYHYRWFRDGVRLDQPESASSLAAGSIRRGEALRVEVVAFDGEVEGPSAAAEARVKNSAPSVAELAVRAVAGGKAITVLDEVVCAVQKPSQDPDREAPKLSFSWFRDGERLPVAPDRDRLPAAAAKHGETLRCEAIAGDGELVSGAARAEATVANTPPGAVAIAIEPESPRAGQDLVCRVTRASEDADGDLVRYAFRWTSAGKPAPALRDDPARLPASAIKKGQTFRCEVTPSDASGPGPVATAESRYVNSPPTRPAVRIAPENPTQGSALSCELAVPATDPDGEAVRYRYLWTKNGVEQGFAQGSAQVPARLLKAGDIWKCAATPSDGESDGPVAESLDAVVQPGQSTAQN